MGLGTLLRLEDDIEGVDDAREVSEAAEDDVDQKRHSAAVDEDNRDGREEESGNEREHPSSVFSAASLALPLTFALSCTHDGFRICAPETSLRSTSTLATGVSPSLSALSALACAITFCHLVRTPYRHVL